ncbi:MAG: ATP-dependent DNA ligase [Microbacterium sp.]|uniref:ATP-dependent DNA ligase n=1 Tax=Microbacterium sp. TaxID=51671 RepID=UPI000DB7D437|nr:ATP-dependent DNA ligase [Microbacterium sp.]PZU40297.1 MAG: ATP-dependent DNA ligase [Microbacterium sp.]
MAGEQVVRVAGRRLRVSNLDKVLYPATGTTKGEVIAYYTRIAPFMIPHVTGRPVTRKRWPDGVGTAEHPESSFFAKDLEPGAPDWVRRTPIPHSGGPKDYPLVGDVATLVYLAQVASLELHVPQWRFTADGERGNPDRIILDLDPGAGVGLAECAAVARWCREILSGMGWDAHPVTSGSKGIHLYAALEHTQTSEQISAFAKELARAVEADHPDLVVSAMSKAARPGKVLIDWSQNNGAKTTIAPYSLRGRPHPTVAAPRAWDELDDPDLAHLDFATVLERVEAQGDPLVALGFHAGGRAADDGPLAVYIAKRDARRTPEPVPSNALGASEASGERPRFVIQEHHASRLHWDLRLERDGVLASWAVPRGVPPTVARNNLAVQTEDHPIEYLAFEGTIPAGEYGAGSMTVWDDGRYDLEKWRDDEIIFTLEGRPAGPLGTVHLALIRTDGTGEKSTWLLHRMKTDASGAPQPEGAPVIALADADDDAPPAERLRPNLATGSAPGLAAAAIRRWSAGAGSDPWVEFKWDGIRALGVWDGEMLRLIGRRGTDITARYPELTGESLGLRSEAAVLDGELVALDETGRPSFSLLQRRLNLVKAQDIAAEARRTPVTYYVFDLIEHDGVDVGALPLHRRRALLECVVADARPPLSAPPIFDDLDAALATAREFGLEGVMVKDPTSTYRRGIRTESWLKVKLTRTQEVVIGAIRPGRGGRNGSIGSLLLGVPGPDGLQYAGRVGTGFSDATLARLAQALTPLRTETNPFVDIPSADASDALWVRPELVAEVEFAEWTRDGSLRHARWRGLRPDKTPADVVRED